MPSARYSHYHHALSTRKLISVPGLLSDVFKELNLEVNCFILDLSKRSMTKYGYREFTWGLISESIIKKWRSMTGQGDKPLKGSLKDYGPMM